MVISNAVAQVRTLVAAIEPHDALEAEQLDRALGWLAATDDIYRRVPPDTPSPHLVSYFLLADEPAEQVLLVDHRKAGLWLPAGGHVEPGEHPVDTVQREMVEELGAPARFHACAGELPLFLTVTETQQAAGRHTDVSLWFILAGRPSDTLRPDPGEFHGVRWWTRAEIAATDPARFDPHLTRMLAKLTAALSGG